MSASSAVGPKVGGLLMGYGFFLWLGFTGGRQGRNARAASALRTGNDSAASRRPGFGRSNGHSRSASSTPTAWYAWRADCTAELTSLRSNNAAMRESVATLADL